MVNVPETGILSFCWLQKLTDLPIVSFMYRLGKRVSMYSLGKRVLQGQASNGSIQNEWVQHVRTTTFWQ